MKSIFNLNKEDFENVAWQKIAKGINNKAPLELHEQFSKKAGELKDESGSVNFKVYSFFSAIFSMALRNDDPDNPFQPSFLNSCSRSFAVLDLTEVDLDNIEFLLHKTDIPIITARFSDILFLMKRGYPYIQLAAENYLKVIESLSSFGNELHIYTEYFRRGFCLSKILVGNKRKEGDLISKYIGVFNRIVEDRKDTESNNTTKYFLEVALEQKFPLKEIEKYAQFSEEIGKRLEKENDFRESEVYFDMALKLYKCLKNSEKIRELFFKKGIVCLKESESRDDLGAGDFFANAINSFRQAGEKDKAEEAHTKFLFWQKESKKHMKKVSFSVDIAEQVKLAENTISGKSLNEALNCLAFGTGFFSKTLLEKEIVETIRKNPFPHIIQTYYTEDDGRITAKKECLLDCDQEKQKDSIEKIMFQKLSHLQMERASSFIEPCRNTVYCEHVPTLVDLQFLVKDSPFVPIGHTEIFIRGIHAGLKGDFIIASYLLVPQIENSIRNILHINDVVTSNLDADMIQKEKPLGALLLKPETIDLFGEDCIFELRCLLIEATGYNYRNMLAHGFISSDKCFSFAAYNVWWFIIRMCLSWNLIKKK